MRKGKQVVLATVLVLATATALSAGSKRAPNPAVAPANGSFDQVVDRIAERESKLLKSLQEYHPLIETYLQKMKPDRELVAVPDGDEYFLAKLDLTSGTHEASLLKDRRGLLRTMLDKVSGLYTIRFLPLGFAQMMMPDDRGLDRQHYDFKFVRREFIGELRCLVVDVQPKKGSGTGRFLGRMWVEDQDYNIVRFNGTFSPAPWNGRYLHFDSWRLNLQPGVWLPAYIYSEESDLSYGLSGKLRFKAQTRLWGYNLQNSGHSEEFTSMSIDAPGQVKDKSDVGQDAGPVEAQRQWERLAEQNALDRLEKAGMIAPSGEVDKVLTTVINNLQVTNNLDIEPEVRARVLLMAPMESFTIGHTIIISRGLLDVLPDEATLAAVLAHELAHIAQGHKFDTKYAFNDRSIFPDQDILRRFNFKRDEREEAEADSVGLKFLQNSPYKDKLPAAGLFLRQLEVRRKGLPHLIQAHMGNGFYNSGRLRFNELAGSAPQLEVRRLDQIASLPLGSRIKLNPWNCQIELNKGKPVPLLAAREKMPFEVTPVFPYLVRMKGGEKQNVASGEMGEKKP